MPPLHTPDGRYIVVRGRLWRATDPSLTEADRVHWVHALQDARRRIKVAWLLALCSCFKPWACQVRSLNKSGWVQVVKDDAEALREARKQVSLMWSHTLWDFSHLQSLR